MNKLITYLKQGKGRGLRFMLIFSVLFSLFNWAINYPMLGNFTNHISHFLGSFASLWILYALVFLISMFFTWAFRLKAQKALLCRSTMVAITTMCLASILLVLIQYVVSAFGELAMQLLYPIIIAVFVPVLLVMLIVSSISETKKK